jgi:GNAT superfamily N-acetyltransferase
MSGFRVERLAPAHAGAFLALFDRSFGDNPDWGGCYCRYYDSPETPWDSGAAASARHRAEAAERIAAGLQTGFLAFPGSGDTPVAWLNAGPAAGFSNPRGFNGAAGAWVMCFVVEPSWRGRGAAAALMAGALEAFRTDGVRSVEGWPLPHGARDSGTAAGAAAAAAAASDGYKGPLQLFERHGFRPVGEGPHGRLHVRLELA